MSDTSTTDGLGSEDNRFVDSDAQSPESQPDPDGERIQWDDDDDDVVLHDDATLTNSEANQNKPEKLSKQQLKFKFMEQHDKAWKDTVKPHVPKPQYQAGREEYLKSIYKTWRIMNQETKAMITVDRSKPRGKKRPTNTTEKAEEE